MFLFVAWSGLFAEPVELGRNAVRWRTAATLPPAAGGASIAPPTTGQQKMARKPATRVEFTLFDVVYEDGSQRSNRRVPSDALAGPDGDAAARAIIEQQDRLIAEKSGIPAVSVKTMHRSGSKPADATTRMSRQ